MSEEINELQNYVESLQVDINLLQTRVSELERMSEIYERFRHQHE